VTTTTWCVAACVVSVQYMINVDAQARGFKLPMRQRLTYIPASQMFQRLVVLRHHIDFVPRSMACFFRTILSHARSLNNYREETTRPPCLPGPSSRPAGRHGPIGERTRSPGGAFELSEHIVVFVDDLTLTLNHWITSLWSMFWSNSLDPSCPH